MYKTKVEEKYYQRKEEKVMKKGIVGVFGVLAGAVAGGMGSSYFNNKVINEKQKKIDKFKGYYNMLNQWLMLKQEGKSLEKYFEDNNYKTIAIYGMGEMGNRLYDELKETEIEVKYAIDKNAAGAYSELDIRELEDELEEVDAVIVTATFAFDEIEGELGNIFSCPIISLDDVVYEA